MTTPKVDFSKYRISILYIVKLRVSNWQKMAQLNTVN